jgi:hypothetical protein
VLALAPSVQSPSAWATRYLATFSGATRVSHRRPDTGATARTIAAILNDLPRNVMDFGAVADGDGEGGGTDNAAAFQAAVDAAGEGGSVFVPNGTYQLDSAITLPDGVVVRGESQVGVILNWAAGVTGFDWNPSTPADRRGFHLRDMTLQADRCVRINRTDTPVTNGDDSSFFVGGSLKRLRLYNITPNAGVAVEMSQAFDTVMEECKVAGTFDVGLLLHASDLNSVRSNRFTGCRSYCIIDRSAASFWGSSNDIHHNDMTLQSNTGATFILSSSLNVNIHDNYLEQIGGGAGVGIAVELVEPAGLDFGDNVQFNSSVIRIENNRIEPEANFAQCMRIDPTKANTIICRNPGSVALLGSSIFTSTGNDVPLIFNANNLGGMEIDILGASWGPVWDGFKTVGGPHSAIGGFSIDGACNKCFPNLSATGDARLFGRRVVMPTTLSGGQLVRFCPDKGANTFFKDGATITVTVVARTRSASGDTLVGGFNSSTYDSGTTNMTLTQQFQKFTFTFAGPVYATTDGTVSLSRSTSNGDIEVASVSWVNG